MCNEVIVVIVFESAMSTWAALRISQMRVVPRYLTH